MANDVEYMNNPEPIAAGEFGMRVHWTGYLADPKPTETLRAHGRAVVVHGDVEIVLPPTSYGLPEPWESRYLRFAKLGTASPMCGGVEGARFLTNGHWMARVDEDVYTSAIGAGFRVVPGSWTTFTGDATIGPIAVRDDLPRTPHDRGERVNVGGVWVWGDYFSLLRELGVTEANKTPDGLMLVAAEVCVVMGIRVPVAEPIACT